MKYESRSEFYIGKVCRLSRAVNFARSARTSPFSSLFSLLEPHQKYTIGTVSFSTSDRHHHPVETYGVIFDYYGRKISFMVDTQYFPELTEDYADSDILVMNVVRFTPHESGDVMHLSIDDVREILTRLHPKKAILTHFGMTMLKAKPWLVANELSDELGMDVIAASDGMTIELEEEPHE